MPIFDQGYQHWQGKLSSHTWRWWTITRNGVRTHLRSRWTRMAVLFAWVPALGLAAVLILWGLIEQQSSLVTPLLSLLQDLPEEIRAGPRNFRVTIWTIAFQYFFQIEMFFTMILVLLVGPSLISQDLRFNAIPLYFSRPLRRIDYFAGKLGVIGVYIAAVAIVPALIAYLLGVVFSLDFSVVKDTSRLLAGSIGYGVVVVLSTGTLMLALSSLTRNSRYVGALWVGIWMISGAVAGALTEEVRRDWCPAVSYTANLQRMGEVLLDTDAAWQQIERLAQAGRSMAGGIPGGDRGLARRGGPGSARRPERMREPLPLVPWYYSAGVLGGLFGLSLCTLTFRVKSLDRLK